MINCRTTRAIPCLEHLSLDHAAPGGNWELLLDRGELFKQTRGAGRARFAPISGPRPPVKLTQFPQKHPKSFVSVGRVREAMIKIPFGRMTEQEVECPDEHVIESARQRKRGSPIRTFVRLHTLALHMCNKIQGNLQYVATSCSSR